MFPQANQHISVPLGDSITEITCWRVKLLDLLTASNTTVNFDLVGSSTTNTQNCVSTQQGDQFDHDHEGHSGYLAINIANSNLTGWLQAAQPDAVSFMLGTNDVAQGRSTDEILAAYTKMVMEMRDSNANMKIIVCVLFCFPRVLMDDVTLLTTVCSHQTGQHGDFPPAGPVSC